MPTLGTEGQCQNTAPEECPALEGWEIPQQRGGLERGHAGQECWASWSLCTGQQVWSWDGGRQGWVGSSGLPQRVRICYSCTRPGILESQGTGRPLSTEGSRVSALPALTLHAAHTGQSRTPVLAVLGWPHPRLPHEQQLRAPASLCAVLGSRLCCTRTGHSVAVLQGREVPGHPQLPQVPSAVPAKPCCLLLAPVPWQRAALLGAAPALGMFWVCVPVSSPPSPSQPWSRVQPGPCPHVTPPCHGHGWPRSGRAPAQRWVCLISWRLH